MEGDFLSAKTLQDADRWIYEEECRRFGNRHGFYSGGELFRKKDLNKKEPSAYVVTNNRNAGKTSYLALLAWNLKKEHDIETLFLVRGVTEMDSYGEVFDDMCALYEFGGEPCTKVLMRNILNEIRIGDTRVGLVAPLKKYVQLKKYSPAFSRVGLIVLDEYQLEDGRFVKDEMTAFHSICRTADRGGGMVSKGVKIILMGNPVELLNPYLLEFGISEKYAMGMNYVRGDGVVAEFKINYEAQAKVSGSGISRLFSSGNDYDYGMSFLYDDTSNMGKCTGKSSYMFTLCYGTARYGVRRELSSGYIHVGGKVDPSCTKILAFREQDRSFNADLLEKRDWTWQDMREAYKLCRLKFENFKAKQITFQLLGVDKYA